MNKQLLVWKFIQQNFQENIPVMILYVLESKGSSPGRQGFFMAVNNKGSMEGSIGGGIMEHKFVEMAMDRLIAGSPEPGVKKQVHNKSAAVNQSGMICSGEQTIFLYTVQEKDVHAISQLIFSLEKNNNGTLRLSPAGIQWTDDIPEKDMLFIYQSDTDWYYQERTGYKNFLSIIGGGHCSLALCNLVRSMDFYIRVYDDRQQLKTMNENTTAHEKHLVDDYAQLETLVTESRNHYLVIMTMGYRTDDIAIRALLEKQFRYFGVLGSDSKMKKMMEQYRTAGIAEEKLKKIQAPAGISIKSETPEEIAVSIAAAIIAVKNAGPQIFS